MPGVRDFTDDRILLAAAISGGRADRGAARTQPTAAPQSAADGGGDRTASGRGAAATARLGSAEAARAAGARGDPQTVLDDSPHSAAERSDPAASAASASAKTFPTRTAQPALADGLQRLAGEPGARLHAAQHRRRLQPLCGGVGVVARHAAQRGAKEFWSGCSGKRDCRRRCCWIMARRGGTHSIPTDGRGCRSG